MGLMLLSYAVNLLLFVSGQLWQDMPPIVNDGQVVDPSLYADPVPQALVLTAIVIGFATTALYLVVLLASRGLTGTDHRSEEHTSELQSRPHLVCRLLLEKKKQKKTTQ